MSCPPATPSADSRLRHWSRELSTTEGVYGQPFVTPLDRSRDAQGGLHLRDLRERIGIPAAKKLRKDELEKAIVAFLRTGSAALPTKRSLRRTGVKDVERGLILKLRIENYTSDRETKDFIIEQARLKAPDVREKSGV